MKILGCGSHKTVSIGLVNLTLNALNCITPITHVVHGDAPMTDRAVSDWATRWRIPQTAYPAQWGQHGKAAGPIRNQQMLDEESIDLVVAFPGGPGTADMVKRAKRAGIETIVVDQSGQWTHSPKVIQLPLPF